MPDSTTDLDVLQVVPAEPVVRGHPVVAWLVIVGVAGSLVWNQVERPAEALKPAPRGNLSARTLTLQGKMLVAARQLTGQADARLDAQLREMTPESVAERLRLVALAGELGGPGKALEFLDDVRPELARPALAGLIAGPAEAFGAGSRVTPRDVRLLDVLRRLYDDYQKGDLAAPSVAADEREALRDGLGWFGELALAPAGGPDRAARDAVLQPAYRVFFTLAGVGLLLLLLGLAGLVGLIVYVVFLAIGKLPAGVVVEAPHGGVYAETFAVWLVLYVGLNLGAGALLLPRIGLLWLILVDLLSLAALAWPVIRGIPWRVVRREIGLTAGHRPWAEPFLGVCTYVMALPLTFVGVLITVLVMNSPLGANFRTPTHPIAEAVTRFGFWGKVQILVLACVLAPLVEETLFRGLLYRHLREAFGRFGRVFAVLLGGLAVSFVFAVVHPQGWLGVPPLMGLALAFTLAREWRGSLVAAMVAHGINNGLAMIGVLTLFGD